MEKVNLIHKFLYVFLCICIIIFSMNYPLIALFRPLDILFIFMFVLFLFTNPKIDKNLIIILLFIIFSFFLSCFLGVIKNGYIETLNYVFIYKYFFLLTVPWIVVSVVKTNEQIKTINSLLLISYLLLCIWVYVYLILKNSGIIIGSFRPSFPTNNFAITDSHLYSSYLGFFTIAYYIYLRNYFKHNFIISTIILINSLISVILVGSRTGLILIFSSVLIYFSYILINFLISSKLNFKSLNPYLKILIYLSILFIFFYYDFYSNLIEYDFFKKNYSLIERAFSFDVINDRSVTDRMSKFLLAVENAEYSAWFLGSGFSNNEIWYDGVFSLLLSHGGFLLILSIVIFYYYILKKAKSKSSDYSKYFKFLFLVVIYLISNLITEHIFITRNSFPILVMITMTYIESIKNKIFRS